MMSDTHRRMSWQPPEDDQLLLQAIVLPGSRGRAAWRAWSSRMALDDVGPAAYRLLPELYHVLVETGEAAPDLA